MDSLECLPINTFCYLIYYVVIKTQSILNFGFLQLKFLCIFQF